MSIAFGWHIATDHGAELIWHNGGTGGYRSFCGFDPKRNKGIVVLTNSMHDMDDLGFHYLEPKYELVDTPKGTTVSAEKLNDYVGYYEMPPGIILHITKEKDQLFAQLTGQDRYPIFAESTDQFFFKVVDARISFQRGKPGAVEQLTLHQGGMDQVAERLPADYAPEERKEVSVPAETLKRYVGRYELAPSVLFDVTLSGDQLTVQITGQSPLPVYATSPTDFYYKIVDAQITFEVEKSGEVTGLVLHQMGRDQSANRLAD